MYEPSFAPTYSELIAGLCRRLPALDLPPVSKNETEHKSYSFKRAVMAAGQRLMDDATTFDSSVKVMEIEASSGHRLMDSERNDLRLKHLRYMRGE